ncbi:hypothetical protein V1512DRAFT_262721 [Lipomyces arxii]|uniref:uncharacterized protein n=1 Tax=Lipomyces arxii TaxID=56418 RepID=UPI0034CE0851
MPNIHMIINAKSVWMTMRLWFSVLATLMGIARLVSDSSVLGATSFGSHPTSHYFTRSHFTTATVASAYLAFASAAPETRGHASNHQARADKPTPDSSLVFKVVNQTVQISLAGGHSELGIAQNLESFSQLTLVSPEEYEANSESFQQYGTLVIPYVPTYMSFVNSSVWILNSDGGGIKENYVVAKPETDLATVFELTSAAVQLMPLNYRCMILKSEPFSTWDTVMLGWRMRNSRRRLAEYLYGIERELKLPLPDSSSKLWFKGLLLLAKNDIILDLDGSTLDLKRAVAATRKIVAACV